jgi:hypothetical protein
MKHIQLVQSALKHQCLSVRNEIIIASTTCQSQENIPILLWILRTTIGHMYTGIELCTFLEIIYMKVILVAEDDHQKPRMTNNS